MVTMVSQSKGVMWKCFVFVLCFLLSSFCELGSFSLFAV